MSLGEQALWEELRNRQLEGVKFRRQQALAQFIVDFFAPSHRLAIEVDGPAHQERAEHDARRQRFLEAQGIWFLRFSTDEVYGDLDGCLERIRAALRSR